MFFFQTEVVRDDVFWGCKRRRILERLRLDGRVAYVTGGGQGIGRAFAHALGEAGAKVAVVDLVLAKAEAVACELSLKGKHWEWWALQWVAFLLQTRLCSLVQPPAIQPWWGIG